MASLRSCGVNEASKMARLPGVSSAPPMPCSTLVAMSWDDPVATAHAAEDRANQATPITKMRLRP